MKVFDPEQVEYPRDELAERRLIACLITGLREPSQSIFCDMERDDFFCWPHDVLFGVLKLAWQEGRLKNVRQSAMAIRKVRDSYYSPGEWAYLVGVEIVEQMSRWPMEFTWREDMQKVLEMSVRRQELRLVLGLIAKTRMKRPGPGELLHAANVGAEQLARKVERCTSQ